jgi:hypothetical protein
MICVPPIVSLGLARSAAFYLGLTLRADDRKSAIEQLPHLARALSLQAQSPGTHKPDLTILYYEFKRLVGALTDSDAARARAAAEGMLKAAGMAD